MVGFFVLEGYVGGLLNYSLTSFDMIGYILIGLLVGGGLGYMVFYARYVDAANIDSLRSRHKSLENRIQVYEHDVEELRAQNILLKQKTEQMLQQNEDYSKMISKLSRYYFHMQEANAKLDELKTILQMFDDGLEGQLHMPSGSLSESHSVSVSQDKRFF